MDPVGQVSLSEGRVRDERSVLKPTLGRSRGVPRRLATFGNGIGAAVVNVELPLLRCLTANESRGMTKGLEVTRPLAVGIVHSGGDVPLGLPAVAQAAGASRVWLPLSSVEPVYGLDPRVLVGKVNHYLDYGHPAPQHQRRRSVLPPEHISLPVRLPGQHHLHPELHRSSWDGPSGRAGSNA